MLGPARIGDGKQIRKLFATLRKAALDHFYKTLPRSGRNERLRTGRKQHGDRFDFRRRIKNRAGQRARQRNLVPSLDENGERAVDLAARRGGQSPADFLLDEKKE